MDNKKKINQAQLKSKWLIVWKHLNAANEKFHVSLNNGISEADKIKLKDFTKSWKKLCVEACSFYEVLDNFDNDNGRVAPVELTLPWSDSAFVSAWNNWIAYMDEQFGMKLSSRTLEQRLAVLKQMSGGDQAKAIEIINHAIANTYKSFYKPQQEEQSETKPRTQKRKDDDFSE